LGGEACRGLFDLGRRQGWAELRAAVPAPLPGARAFAEHLGMREVARTVRRLAAGETELVVMRVDLAG
jgi:hypothetical protein